MSAEHVAWVWFKHGRGFVVYAWRRFVGDRCLGIAATLSYTSLLALVPLAAIMFAVLAAVPLFEGARDSINSFVFENFVPDTGEQIAAYFDAFVDNAGRLKAIGIAGLVVASVMLLATIGSTFNTIFRVARPRRLPSRLFIYMVVLVLGPIALGAGVSLATNVSDLAEWLGYEGNPGQLARLNGLVSALIVFAVFSLLYLVVPNQNIAWRNALIGGLSAGILFVILRWVFGLYLAYFPIYRTIYGALSAIPIFLVWMYLSWSAFLVGAVVTASLAEWRSTDPLDRG